MAFIKCLSDSVELSRRRYSYKLLYNQIKFLAELNNNNLNGKLFYTSF